LWHFGQGLLALAVVSPCGVLGVGQEDADAFHDDGPPWHPLVITAEHEGRGDQRRFERVRDAGVAVQGWHDAQGKPRSPRRR
jgi:hypothetical protein